MSETTPNNFNFGSFVTGFTKAERMNLPELSFFSYLTLVAPLGKEVQEETGIIAMVPLVQSAHESRAGNSKLAKEYGNLFGFKATTTWKNNGRPVVDLPTWEIVNTDTPDKYKDFSPELVDKYKDGNKEMFKLKIKLKQEFRVYDTWRDSFWDWGRLISTISWYREAYHFLKNKETVRDGIRRMAMTYATDHNYARNLLILYDKAVGGGAV